MGAWKILIVLEETLIRIALQETVFSKKIKFQNSLVEKSILQEDVLQEDLL